MDVATQQRRQKLAFILIVLVSLLVTVAILLFAPRSKQPDKSSPGIVTTHYDANSGETTRTIKGENNSGVSSDTPIFLGTNALLDRGVSSNQLTNLETAFYRYIKLNSLKTKQVSITVKDIKTSMLNAGTADEVNVINFPVVFDDQTTYQASLQYSGLNNTELILADNNGNQLYDSGIIDAGGPSGD